MKVTVSLPVRKQNMIVDLIINEITIGEESTVVVNVW